MTIPRSAIRVLAYSGYRGEEEPRAIEVEGRQLEVTVLRRWQGPEGRWFETVDREGGKHTLLCLDPELSWWRVGD